MSAPDVSGDSDAALDVGKGSRTGKALLAASTMMAAGTLISRVLGVFRQSLQIAALGGQVKGDIFQMATTLPNQAYQLIAGGTLNAILVPLIVRATKEDDDRGVGYINRIITLFLLLMAGATALCMLATPLLLRINNPIWFDPQHRAVLGSLTTLTYLTLPQIFFFGVYFICGQALNARERFGPMMWAPIANNVVSVAMFVFYLMVNGTHGDPDGPYTGSQLLILGLGSTLGIVAQAAFMVFYLYRVGINYRPRFDFKGTGLGRTFHVAKWVILTVIVGQVAVAVTNMIANGATLKSPQGAGQAVLNYANLLWLTFHGLITVSITTALLPAIAGAFTDGRMSDVRGQTMRALKLTNVTIIPISVALVVFAFPISQLIFGYGHGHDSVPAVAWTLVGFAVGMPLYTAVFVLARTLYALEDSKASMWVSMIFDVFWMALSALLVLPFDAPRWTAPMIALAYSLAHIPTLLLTFHLMRSRVPGVSLAETVRHWVRLLLACLPAALASWFIVHALTGPRTGKLMLLLVVLIAGAVAAVLFYVCARILHIREVGDTVALVLRRGRGDEPAPAAIEEPTVAPTAGFGEATLSTDAQPVVADAAPEADPEPAVSDHEPEAMDTEPAGPAAVDLLLAGRYRLTRFVVRRGTTETWEAFDETLSRPVLVHLLRPDDPRAGEALGAARRAAVATDSRFLRVLDAVHSDASYPGAYLVSEYVGGRTLEAVLADGPLSAFEAAWITREAADALAPMHGRGLFHGRLNPDTVVITDTGNVKVVGFGTEASLHPHPDDDALSDLDWAAADVESLGKLLYAGLTGAWPGGPRYGLPAAPRVEGRWATPRETHPEVPPTLDQICDQILSRPPRHGRPALRSVEDIATALTRVLGSADATGDLERRMNEPGVGTEAIARESALASAGAPRAEASRAVPAHEATDTTAVIRPVGSEDETSFIPAVSTIHAPHRAGATVVDPDRVPSERGEADLTSLPDTASAARPRQARLPWGTVIASLIAVALFLGSVGAVAALSPRHHASPAPTATPSPVYHALPLQAAKDYDPEGSGAEVPGEVAYAIDRDPTTVWHTENYGSAKLGNTVNHKTGVGLYVDLGENAPAVQRVVVTLQGVTDLDVRVPTAGQAVPKSSADWTTIGHVSGVNGTVTIPLTQHPQSRYVLLWLTSLPEVSTGVYRGGIAEVEVDG